MFSFPHTEQMLSFPCILKIIKQILAEKFCTAIVKCPCEILKLKEKWSIGREENVCKPTVLIVYFTTYIKLTFLKNELVSANVKCSEIHETVSIKNVCQMHQVLWIGLTKSHLHLYNFFLKPQIYCM